MAKTAGKIIAWVIVILLLVGAAFGYYKFFWVFSDGTKTGELNSLTYTDRPLQGIQGRPPLARL